MVVDLTYIFLLGTVARYIQNYSKAMMRSTV